MRNVKEIICEIVKAELDAPLLDATRITRGKANITYNVQLPHEGVIVRLSHHPKFLEGYHKEAWAAQQAAAAGVPVARTLAIGGHDRHSYMIQSRISGACGADYKGDPLYVPRELGRLCRLVNSVAVQGFGGSFEWKGEPRFTDTWEQFIEGKKRYLFGTDTLVASGALLKDEFERAVKFLEPMDAWAFEPHLVHGDVGHDNSMVSLEDEVHLVDWGLAQGLPVPHYDMGWYAAFQSDPRKIAAFAKGYGFTQEEYDAMRHDLNRIALTSILNAAVWSVTDKPQYAAEYVGLVQRKAPAILGGTYLAGMKIGA